MRTESEIRRRLDLLRRIVADSIEPSRIYVQAAFELAWVLGESETPPPAMPAGSHAAAVESERDISRSGVETPQNQS